MPAATKKTATPSGYTPALGAEIAHRMHQHKPGELPPSLLDVCQAEDMPDPIEARIWLRHEEGFRAMYAEALEYRAQVMVDQILRLSARRAAMLHKGQRGADLEAATLEMETLKWVLEFETSIEPLSR